MLYWLRAGYSRATNTKPITKSGAKSGGKSHKKKDRERQRREEAIEELSDTPGGTHMVASCGERAPLHV